MIKKKKIIMSDGCSIYVEDEGSGPPVLLIPGLGSSTVFWHGVISGLVKEGYRAITFDHRNTGRSDRVRNVHSLAQLVQDTSEIITTLEVSKVHVVGHSMGGMVAQGLAIDSEHLINKLVLSGTWAKPDAPFYSLFYLRKFLLLNGNLSQYNKLTIHLGYTPEWIKQNWSDLATEIETEQVTEQTLIDMCERIDMLLAYDRYTDLINLKVSVLIIGATDDFIIPLHHSKELYQKIENSHFVQMSGGHFFPKTEADLYIQTLINYFNRKNTSPHIEAHSE